MNSHSGSPSPSPPAPLLCSGGCGFYGREDTDQMCSRCYTSKMEQKQQSETITKDVVPMALNDLPPSVPSTPTRDPQPASNSSEHDKIPDNSDQSPIVDAGCPSPTETVTQAKIETPAHLQKNIKRCWECKHKHGLLGFKCKCGFTFCSSHRHASTHNCGYDHARDGIIKLEMKSVKVVPDKLQRF